MLTKEERAFIISLFQEWRNNKISARSIAQNLNVDSKDVEKFLIEVNKIAL